MSESVRVTPPPGWTDEEKLLFRGLFDDGYGLASDLSLWFGLRNVAPVWGRKVEYLNEGTVIFEALTPGATDKSFYLWAVMPNKVYRFELKTLEEIGRAIAETGGKEGYVDELVTHIMEAKLPNNI